MPDESLPGPTPTGYQRTQGGGFRWQPPAPEHLAKLLPQYEIEALIGRGGMGAVYRGKQRALDRPVAIKILPPEVDDEDTSYSERFKNEAKIMARLEHPAIVPVYDFGETSEGQLYFVMSFINGTDIHQMVQSQGRLPPEHALAITAHVCDALAYAHKHGVIHRDIKPSNVLINMDGEVKVADFGLAKVDDPSQSSGLTKTGLAMGTPDYVAPEALTLGMTVDGRADLYAVGVMLYQMLTGNVPRGMFTMPSVMIRDIDPRFDQIVAKAMKYDREERYSTAGEIRRDLDTILTMPLVQSGGASSAAIPKAAVAQKPGAKGPQKPMGKSANVPVRSSAAPEAPGKAGASSSTSQPTSKTLAWVVPTLISAVVIIGGAVMMRGTRATAPADGGEAGKPPASTSSSAIGSAPVKLREAPKSAAPAAPISNAKSSISDSSAQQFLPGKWVKVFTKLEDLPEEMRKADSGLKFEDGWIVPSGKALSVRADQSGVGLKAFAEVTNGGIRLRVRNTGNKSTQIKARYSSKRLEDIMAAIMDTGHLRVMREHRVSADSKLLTSHLPNPPINDGDSYMLELGVVGSVVYSRLNSELIAPVSTDLLDPGSFAIYGRGAVRDIEVINLDGIPEAEALKILGVAEKGNDLRQPPAVASTSPALPVSTTPTLPISKSSPLPVSASSAAFPPGQWLKVFTKFEDLPLNLRKPDSGVKWDNGTLSVSKVSTYVGLSPPMGALNNCALRAVISGEFSIRLHDCDNASYYNFLSHSIELWNRETGNKAGSTRKLQTFSTPTSKQPHRWEFAVFENHLVTRCDDKILAVATNGEVPAGKITLANLEGTIHDIEVINLDGIPATEAFHIIGIDGKGNDTRAAELALDKKMTEQAKVVDGMAAIPELKTLHEQFVKLQAERVNAPFDADVAKLNTSYLGGLDRKIADAKQKGDLDGVLVLEAEKKLIGALARPSKSGSDSVSGRGLEALATSCPLPAEDTDSTPATLKGLRQIYRDAFAKLAATRAANLKALTGPLFTRLKQIESTLTQQNRIDHATIVRQYVDAISGSGADRAAGHASAPPQTKTPAAPGQGNVAVTHSQREVLDWLLSLGATVVVKDGTGERALTSGDKIRPGRVVILRIETPDANLKWNITDDDLSWFAGLDDLTKLDFPICDKITGAGLHLIGPLPALDQLDMNFPQFNPANFANMPDFPKLRALVSLPAPQFSAADFAKVPPLKELRTINAGSNITEENLPAICARTKLTSLSMPNNQLSDDGLVVVAQAKNLEVLGISGTEKTLITGSGLTHLAALPKLRDLTVGNHPAFQAKNAALLSNLKALTSLRVAGGDLNDKDEWVKHLSGLKGKLTTLSLSAGACFTPQQVAALKKALPKVDVKVN